VRRAKECENSQECVGIEGGVHAQSFICSLALSWRKAGVLYLSAAMCMQMSSRPSSLFCFTSG
jgi:hypothetical protein